MSYSRDERLALCALLDKTGPAYRFTARNATPAVTVIGSPAELTLWVTGRRAAARVRLDGTEAAVSKLAAW